MISYQELLATTRPLDEIHFCPDSRQVLDYHYSINPDGSIIVGQTAETAGYALTIPNPKQAGGPELLTFSCRLNSLSEPAPVLLEVHPFNVETEFEAQLTPIAVLILPLPRSSLSSTHLVISSPLRPILSPKDGLPVSLFTLQFSDPETPINPFLGDQILVYGTHYYEVFIDHCCQNETSRSNQRLFPLSPTTDLVVGFDGQEPFINLGVYPQRTRLSAHQVRLPLTHEVDWSLVEKALPYKPHPHDLQTIFTEKIGFAVS